MVHSKTTPNAFTPAEQAFLYAVRKAEQQRIPSPPFKEIARESGFKISSLHHARQRLEERDIVCKHTVREKYAQKIWGGRVKELERERTTYNLTESGKAELRTEYLQKNKKHPPINEFDTPHRKHSFSDSVDDESEFVQREMKNIWDLYRTEFVVGNESLGKTLYLLKKAAIKLLPISELRRALLIGRHIPFIKIANRFGFQEAVVECYQRQNMIVGASSKHIDKYSSRKVTLFWLLKNAARILRGDFDEKPISQKQIDFGQVDFGKDKGELGSDDLSSIEDQKGSNQKFQSLIDLKQTIKSSKKSRPEKEGHLHLLEYVSPQFYTLWLKELYIIQGMDGMTYILIDNPFYHCVLSRTFFSHAFIKIVETKEEIERDQQKNLSNTTKATSTQQVASLVVHPHADKKTASSARGRDPYQRSF